MRRLIEELRVDLGDVDGLGYSDEILAEYINDAYCEIATLKPEKFTKPKIMKAQRGEVQCVSGCCSSLVSVLGVVDKCGNPLTSITQGNTDLAKAFDKTPMKGTKTNYTFSIVPDTDNMFIVAPPIKPSDDVWFSITCVERPAPKSLDDKLDGCEHHSLVKHFALAQAFYTETESQTSIAMGDRHIKLFYQLLGLERKTDKENDTDK